MEAKDINEHPVFKEMLGYGLTDEQQIRMAFNVYLDLCEVKGFWNVKCHKCSEVNVVVLSGHAHRSQPREVILPVSCDSELSPAQIQTYIEKVKIEGYDTVGLVLAFCSPDSGIVYYKVTDGLVQPESPEESEFKRQVRQNRVDFDRNHVRKHTAHYIANRTEQTEAQDSVEKNDKVIMEPSMNKNV